MAEAKVVTGFDAVDSTPETKGSGAHRIAPKVTRNGDNLVLNIPVSEIGKAKPSQGKSGAVGFMLDNVDFEQGGKTYRLRAHWVTLQKVQ